MSDNPLLAFTGMGMASSLGNARHGCAAARAGLSRPAELNLEVTLEDEIMPVALAGYPCIEAEGFYAYGRLAYLAWLAVSDLIQHYPASALRESSLIVNIPSSEERPALDRQCASMDRPGRDIFRDTFVNLLSSPGVGLQGRSLYVMEEGGAGLGKALQAAQQILAGGKARSCMVICADSFLDDVTLESFVEADRIQTPDKSHGFLPGEAAVALVIEPAKQAKQVLGILDDVRLTEEDYSFPLPFELFQEPVADMADESADEDEDQAEESGPDYTARQYAGLLMDIMPEDHAEQRWVCFHDLNGEMVKAMEWGELIVQIAPEYSALRDQSWELPALSFGHTGATGPALAVCMALHGGLRQYLKGHRSVIAAGSDRGLRTAIRLSL